MVNPLSSKQFQKAVLTWYQIYGRKNLPWQQGITPYRVWLSEIMLQQTQVNTVIPYFERFLQTFPDVESLAAAEVDEVMHLWTGLGYYSRARNLHKAAKMIVDVYAGEFPQTVDQLVLLPGIGRSTAAAIVSTAFNQPATVLDGNVKRVLSRYIGIKESLATPSVEKYLWEVAESYTPNKHCRDYTQVMMDLGATLCTRTKPHCDSCPLQATCMAFLSGNPVDFPGKKSKKTLPIRNGYLLLLENKEGVILLEKRPPSGIWGGLWCLPDYSGDLSELNVDCQRRFGVTIEEMNLMTPFRHTFSHFHYDITPIRLSVVPQMNAIREQTNQLWYDKTNPQKVGLAQPIRALLHS
ncbi:MAG: A/G-specific adenine glycosylase [Gammaproteobacteria bacterium]|nr:A/G-specific adenine glycosylase [Gammaproteobacteria bacterium]